MQHSNEVGQTVLKKSLSKKNKLLRGKQRISEHTLKLLFSFVLMCLKKHILEYFETPWIVQKIKMLTFLKSKDINYNSIPKSSDKVEWFPKHE